MPSPSSVRTRVPARIAIAVAFIAVALTKIIDFDGNLRYLLDADVYAVGGRRVLEGLPLYEGTFPTSIDVWLPFTYPPIAAILFAPLALIPLPVVFVLVTSATIAALWWVLKVVVGKLGGVRPADAGWAALALTAALLWFGPVHTTIGFGQVNVILMMLVAIDVLVVPPKYRGLLTGTAIAVKLTPAVFGLWFLLRLDWAGIARIAAAAGGLTLLGHLILPADSTRYWLDTLVNTGRIGGPMYASNQSIDAELWRLGLHTNDGGGGLWLALVVVAFAVTVAVMLRLLRNGKPFLAAGANAIFGLLASPVSWSHHWVWVPVIVVAVAVPALRSRGTRVVLPWVFVVSGVLCFILEPQGLAPAEDMREMDWSPFWHVFGNMYLWWGVAALVMLWFLATRLPTEGGSPMTADHVRLTAWAHGHVQGVGFRWATRVRALELGLTGYAKNYPDGRVLVIAEGPASACDELLSWLEGPDAPGSVSTVVSDVGDARGGYEGFARK